MLGYLVYVGTEPGVYPEVYDVGNQRFFVYPNVVLGQEYFFAVAGYNATGIGSPSQLSTEFPTRPSLLNPGDQANGPGEFVALQLTGTDVSGQPVTYAVTGLPQGLTVGENSGLISGVPTTVGVYSVTATAARGQLFASQTFTWVIDDGPPTMAITSPTTEATYSTEESTLVE